ncbi:uncharacterized protein [Onthophagus taurus]|uniref:uncharacterized protein n=1 Tax=Onthophagus taurus TaxID=166361 RepID=UPI0039BE22DB
MRVSFCKFVLLLVIVYLNRVVGLEHGHASLEEVYHTFHDVPVLKIKKSVTKIHHGGGNNFRDEWIPGHVEHHAFIPGHVHHVLIPTAGVLVTTQHHSHPDSHVNVFKSHIGGFGVGLDNGGHGAGHGFHVWTAYSLR